MGTGSERACGAHHATAKWVRGSACDVTSLGRNVAYTDLGEAYLDRSAQQRVTKGLVRRLERMGYDVTLSQRAA